MGRQAGPIKHGTNGGHVTHVNRGEPPCDLCKAAHARYMADLRQRSRDSKRRERQTDPANYRRGKCAPGLGWPLEARRG